MTSEAAHAFTNAQVRAADVGSVEIAYRTFGEGQPLLFIHGWPLSGFTWRHCVPRLAAKRRCIVPDSPGAGAAASFRVLLRSPRFRRSGMGFGGCFVDMALIEGEFHDAFVQPLLDDTARLRGQLRYLRGIDWKLVDSFATRHREIAARTLLVWGTEDPTFPLERGLELRGQLARCDGLREVPGAKLLVHEEKPDAVVDHVVELLAN